MTNHNSPAWDVLRGHRFVALTTFRKTGVPVVTPVWFVLQSDGVLVFTGRTSGRVKRLRNNPQVEFSPSDFRGKSLGPAISGIARFVPENEWPGCNRAFQKKYGVQSTFFGILGRISGDTDRLYLKISPF